MVGTMNTKRTNVLGTNRLPGYDTGTRRLEWTASLSLGLAGLVLVGMTVRDSLRFAEDRDCIAAVLSSGPDPNYHRAGIAARSPVATNNGLIQSSARCCLPQITSMDFRPKSW